MNKQRPLTLAMIRKTPRVRARGRSFVVTRAKRVKARGREPQVVNALHQLVHLLLTFEASGFAEQLQQGPFRHDAFEPTGQAGRAAVSVPRRYDDGI
jgi:hypothetical protein